MSSTANRRKGSASDRHMARADPSRRPVSAKNAITAAMLDQSQLRSQYRVVRPDGSERHIASLAAVVTDTVDGSSRLVGIDLDISERIEADERERKLQQKFRDSSRLAGMAEIATNVLHNIGNVLNSIKYPRPW